MTESAVKQIRKAKGAPRRKYNVASAEKRTYNGIAYHSKLEARVAQWLDLRLRKKCSYCSGEQYIVLDSGATQKCIECRNGFTGGDVLKWERQVPFALKAYDSAFKDTDEPYTIIGTYRADFKVYFDGREEIWEVKGWNFKQKKHPTLTPLSKLKIAIFKANNPEKDFRIIDERSLPDGY